MPSKSDARSSGRATATARLKAEARLLAEREGLAARIHDGHAPSHPPESHQQPAESSVDGLAHDLEFLSREAVFARVALVDGALERLRSGTYGRCVDCGGPIEPKRLAHDPAVACCLECQSAGETPRRLPSL